jgi:hypothetical protein
MASKFQSKIIKEYQKKGYLVIKVIRFSDNGWPDLQCIKLGEPTTWIECKEANDTLKPLQEYRIDQLNEAGQIAFCLKDGLGKIYP